MLLEDLDNLIKYQPEGVIIHASTNNLTNGIIMLNNAKKIAKERVLLNRALTSTQLHPPPPSSLQHPQQHLNQNIARNCAISPNLGQKIKNCPF